MKIHVTVNETATNIYELEVPSDFNLDDDDAIVKMVRKEDFPFDSQTGETPEIEILEVFEVEMVASDE